MGEKREELAARIRQKYPDRIPVIVERGKNVPDIDKQKFLVPGDLTVGKFTNEIKKHMKVDNADGNNIDSLKAIFLFVNGKSLTRASDKMSTVYEQHVTRMALCTSLTMARVPMVCLVITPSCVIESSSL